MRHSEYRARVEAAIASRPHLLPVYTSVFYIPERIRELYPSFFVVYNAIRHLQKVRGEKPDRPPPGVIPKWGGWFEIHSLDHPLPNTFEMYVRFGELDERIIREIRMSDVSQKSVQQIIREIEEREEQQEKSRLRQWQNTNESLARELYLPFARVVRGGPVLYSYSVGGGGVG